MNGLLKPIKPIETHYMGYRFRSRLEARWAVFFTRMGMKWEYEKEGYSLPSGKRYLPDFFFPEFPYSGNEFPGSCFIEIKPTMPDPESDDWAKISEMNDNYESIGIPVFLLVGEPKNFVRLYKIHESWNPESFYYIAKEDNCLEKPFLIGFFTEECCCVMGKNGYSVHHPREILHEIKLANGKSIKEAISAAKSARFEFGEAG
jgi:hypothetical protein